MAGTQADPKSLGKVVVAAAGTPVPVKASGFTVRQVTIQSDPANAGTYMFVKDAAGNIMAKLTKGQSFTPPTLPSAGHDLNQILLDTDTNGDGCYVCYV
jgi:hypothetical protein